MFQKWVWPRFSAGWFGGKMSAGARIFWALVEVLVAMLIGAIAAPVMWFIIRVLGLIPPIRLELLVFGGGGVLGALAGSISLAVVLKSLGERDRLALVVGAVGGAIGGVCSSVMFFPIVVIL
jgi:hypothetical protein